MPKTEAYLALEAALASAYKGAWDRKASKIVSKLVKLAKKGDYAAADEVVKSIAAHDIAEGQRRRAEEIGTACVLFGASRIVALKHSTLAKQEPPEHVAFAVDQMSDMASDAVMVQVRRAASQALELWEQSQIQKADMDLADMLNAAVLGTGRGMFDLTANLTTSRLVSFGFLAEAREKGVTRYQLEATLDKRTSAVCLRLHGKTFEVEQAYGVIDKALRVTDPDELAGVHPWLRGTKSTLHDLEHMHEDQLLSKYGVLVPPFHPRCRTLLVKVGKVHVTDVSYTPVSTPTVPLDAAGGKTTLPTVLDQLSALGAKTHNQAFNPTEIAVIDAYTGNLHYQLNSLLRHGAPGDEEVAEYLMSRLADLDAAMNKGVLASAVTVYRGVSSIEKVFGASSPTALIGQIFSDQGFMSTTLSLEVAREFVSPKGAIIELHVPGGVHALVPSSVPGVATTAEYEVLLDRGLIFRVVGVTAGDTETVVRVEVSGKLSKSVVVKAAKAKKAPAARFVWQAGDLRTEA